MGRTCGEARGAQSTWRAVLGRRCFDIPGVFQTGTDVGTECPISQAVLVRAPLDTRTQWDSPQVRAGEGARLGLLLRRSASPLGAFAPTPGAAAVVRDV